MTQFARLPPPDIVPDLKPRFVPDADSPADWITAHGAQAGGAVMFFAPCRLQARLTRFLVGFGGMVTFAVKANPQVQVIDTLVAGGVQGFDVASPEEIALLRDRAPHLPLHYNNPVRSRAEIAAALSAGLRSWSVDCGRELDKLLSAGLGPEHEIAVRFRLPVAGASYDFGAKFGAEPAEAAILLARVAQAGLQPSLTFHVGTQCRDPAAWSSYMREAAAIARRAGVRIARLNVGGGFPSARDGVAVALDPFFAAIREGLAAFDLPPALICEPGRGLVADAFAYGVQVKSLRDGRVYLADGIYGGLSEFPSMGLPLVRALSPDGIWRHGAGMSRSVFGPTCDSLDRLPGNPALPSDLEEEDWLIFSSTGAYAAGVNTRFNGYGQWRDVVVADLD